MVVLVNNTIFTLKKTKLRDRADRLVLVAFYDIWPGNGGVYSTFGEELFVNLLKCVID